MSTYSLHGHGSMLRDRARVHAFAEALRRAVRPGSVVVDIGTGTGILAVLACRFGARHVYAIEPDDIVQVARMVARENQVESRITVCPDSSLKVDLPEKANIIVSDLRGILPPFARHFEIIRDARRRFLAPGGVLIPRRDVVWAACVQASDVFNRDIRVWEATHEGVSFAPVRPFAVNAWCKQDFRPGQLLSAPQPWAEFDYMRLENDDVTGTVKLIARRGGTAHGVAMWFDCFLDSRISFSNAPGRRDCIYGNAFFTWPEPVRLAKGDSVSFSLHAKLVGEDYIWDWQTVIAAANGRRKAEFKQCSFLGVPVSPERLLKRSDAYQPTLSEEGEVERAILGYMDGNRSLMQIAEAVASQFPAKFATTAEAFRFVAGVSERFSR